MAAVLLGLVLGAIVVELAVRARYGAPLAERTPILEIEANRHRGFAMVPGQEHYTYLHRTRTNALGLRGHELGERTAGRERVLLLGDSLVYGQGVADEHTIGALLEAALARAGRDVEVVNGGVRAYATHQELGLLEELGDRIAPDAVVLCWFSNDIQERDLAATAARLEASGPVAFDAGEPLRGLAWWRWQGLQVLRSSALLMELHDRRKAHRASPPAREAVDAAFARFEGYLDRFVAWCAERDVSFAVVVLPDASLLHDPAHHAAALQARAAACARERGIPTVDLTEALRAGVAALGRVPTLPYDGHYDADGNRILAEALAGFLGAPDGPLARTAAPPR